MEIDVLYLEIVLISKCPLSEVLDTCTSDDSYIVC